MKITKIIPKISFIIPTLNAQLNLDTCLKSIRTQHYPQNKIEIIISDGGSVDNTINIAKKHHAIIIKNPLKTAEAGKAVGVIHATGDYIALIDSDNILPINSWLSKMIQPLLDDKDLIGSEPWEFTYRKKSGFIERYSALLGANDPYAFISGIYDRRSYLTNTWTDIKLETINYKNYLKVKLQPNSSIPTIGANGTIFRSSFLKTNLKTNYLFDIDIISQVINQTQKPLFFAKVKIGIIHTYCESSIRKFIKKQKRRIIDYYQFKNLRQFDWNKTNKSTIPKFIFYTLTLIPLFKDTLKGIINKPDIAWFFHPIACIITTYIYSLYTIKFKLGLLTPLNRNTWKQ